MHPLVIGIAGGSGSGKTTVGSKIIEIIGKEKISFLEMDSYYKDLAHIPLEKRTQHNFDHPSSYDINLFLKHIIELKKGRNILKPKYDYVSHTRIKETVEIISHPVIIVEGILLYENSDVRQEIDIKTYVETPPDIRFIRRLMRDLKERGRTAESVVNQYYKTVRPMHMAFVEPTREYADIIIPWKEYNEVAIHMVVSRIEGVLNKRVEP